MRDACFEGAETGSTLAKTGYSFLLKKPYYTLIKMHKDSAVSS